MHSIVTVDMGMQCRTSVTVLLVYESEGPVFYDLIHLIRAIRRYRNVLKHLGRRGRNVHQHPRIIPDHHDLLLSLSRPHLQRA